ncbi:hypothetical protein NHP190003_13590 [Helicobacter sp. NHP19-003]|uniref:Min27-like integrase DNA-binding domain-containing protein n=2 Tax=Helicobacter gastrocanis TaxID=2849641 RepID=A0ABM7SBN6_9HELI|nr:hypothetical protein NHP190003_13590 [Helicobacter sp. NHP19-003]
MLFKLLIPAVDFTGDVVDFMGGGVSKRKKMSLGVKDTPKNRKKVQTNEAQILKKAKTGNKNTAPCVQAYLQCQEGLSAS